MSPSYPTSRSAGGPRAATLPASATPPFTAPPPDDAALARIAAIAYRRFGLDMTEKQALLETRLAAWMHEMGLASYAALADRLEADVEGQLIRMLGDRVSTNHTYFNREPAHFDAFRSTILPEALARKAAQRDLRIWCAGCSTGEEAYMLVMHLREAIGADYDAWRAGVLATDVSERALVKARAGVYTARAVDAVPEPLRARYFAPLPDGRFRIVERVRREVTFRRFNLMHAYPFRQPFDVTFCRNVMIYFDHATIGTLVQRFARHTAPGGYLVVGHAESLGDLQGLFSYVLPGVYRRLGGDR